jgi:uncharacterized protein
MAVLLLLPLLLLPVAVMVAARVFEWMHLYKPVRKLEGDPSEAGLEFEDVSFMTEDLVKLHGWWIPHAAARGTIVYCHGNAGNIGGRVSVAAGLHALRVNVLLFDYRGYGQSRGVPTEKGTYRDACAAFEVARARHDDADRPPVIALGASLGGAVAAELACRKPVRGLVIEGTFDSATAVGEWLYPQLPVRWLCRFRYDAAARVATLAVPKLFAHSRDDEVIPFEMGERLFQRASHPKSFVPLRGEHGEAGWEDNPAYAAALRAFVDQVLRPQ